MTTISKTMYTLTTSQFAFIKAIRPFAKSTKQFTVPHSVNFPFTLLNTWAKKAGYSICPMWIMTADRKVSRGIYSLPEFCADDSVISVIETKRGRKSGSKNHNTPKTKTVQVASATEKVSTFSAVLSSVSSSAATELSSDMTTAEMVLGMTNGESDSFVPAEDPNYVSWGYHTEIKKIIKSGAFCPVFITGLSGNGKTTMVEQACAQLGRECIRVNLTAQTDEDELIGGFRLQNGQTVFCPGPALVAMTRGAVLLLDEVDLGTHLIMCLQSILEGKGKFIPKIGKFVRPAKGFTIMATANTKGKGSEDGRFIGTNQMNEAFLERFRFTYEQDYA